MPTTDELDVLVAEWHETPGPLPPLHEYLGMTWEQYAHWTQTGEIPA